MTSWKDPEIGAIRAAMIAMAPPLDAPPPSWEERRARMDGFASLSPPPENVRVEATTLGGVAAERLTPENATAGAVILYLHGGGYCQGSPLSHRGLVGRIAAAAHRAAVVIDYRMGPEHPFPAAVDDALAVWRALLAEGLDAARMAVMGDSAGGGLTFALALAIKDAGLPLPGALATISPWVDLAQTGAAYQHKAASDPMISKAGLDEYAAAYLGGSDPRAILASPLRGDLGGLPPTLIQVGGEEALLTDSTAIAEKIALAGGDVTLRVWPEMIHVWHFFALQLAAGRAAIDEAGEWIRARVP